MGFADRLRASLDWSGFPGRVSFAAWDLDEREPVLHDAERVVHAASTIKVLTMIAALREVRDGRIALDTEVGLPAERAGGFGVLRELRGVHRLQLADLIALMIVISDNAATNAVIDVVGFDAIRACAEDLGCTATRVQRRLMDVHAPGRNETTALDQARVLDALATGAALPADLTRHALDVLSRQQVRDRLPARLPDGARCWNKTGELDGLRHDVGLLGPDRPRAVVAVLVDGLDDELFRGVRGGPACAAIADLGRAAYAALSGARR
ncbi:serine hydrolase [Saccharopolyspora rosea]|uniref:serine hydrolase n=1 Tax=Saccharopolyspora rosea TaxID=524884 RepID=UPI0021DA0285|nr:serine hydrolase [Saccharopolyspora rosea]